MYAFLFLTKYYCIINVQFPFLFYGHISLFSIQLTWTYFGKNNICPLFAEKKIMHLDGPYTNEHFILVYLEKYK